MPQNQIRENIHAVVSVIKNYPDAIYGLLDLVKAGKLSISAVKGIWGVASPHTLYNLPSIMKLKNSSGEDLFRNGLLEELIDIDKKVLSKIISDNIEHPFIKEITQSFNITRKMTKKELVDYVESVLVLVRNSTKEDREELSDNIADLLKENTEQSKRSVLIKKMVESTVVEEKINIAKLISGNVSQYKEVLKCFKYNNKIAEQKIESIFFKASPIHKIINNVIKMMAQNDKSKSASSNLIQKLVNDLESIGIYQDIAKDLSKKKLLEAIISHPEFIEGNIYPAINKYLSDSSAKNLKQVVFNIVELIGKENVRDELPPLINAKFINDVFLLPNLHDNLYKELVHDLAKDNPRALQELLGEILASDVNGKVEPFISDVLEYLYLPPESENADKVFNSLMDNLLTLASQRDIATKIAPLLSSKLVENVFALPQLKNMSSLEPLASNFSVALSKHPKHLRHILASYKGFKDSTEKNIEKRTMRLINSSIVTLADKDIISAITDKEALTALAEMLNKTNDSSEALEYKQKIESDMPQILVDNEDQIIAGSSKVEYETLKVTANMVASLHRDEGEGGVVDNSSGVGIGSESSIGMINHKGKEDIPEQTSLDSKDISKENGKGKELKAVDYFNILAAHPDPAHNKIKELFAKNKGKISEAVDLLCKEAPKNGVIKLLNNFGIGGREIVNFVGYVSNPSGLKAIGRYIDSPTTLNLTRIFIDTNTLGFGIKHLMISYGNSLKDKTKDSKILEKETWAKKVKELKSAVNQFTLYQ